MPENNPSLNHTNSNIYYAGFWQRVGALLIDALILAIPLYLVAYALSNDFDPKALNQPPVPATAYHIFRVGLSWLYFSWFESSRFQATVGKLVFRIKVITGNGEKLTFAAATIRYFGKVLALTFLGIGCLPVLFSKKKQAFHDYLVETEVVKQPGFGKKTNVTP